VQFLSLLALLELSKATEVLAPESSPCREGSFDGTADRNLVVVMSLSLLCSAGQSFSHQFDMRGILLSGKDGLFRENRLFTECQEGIVSILIP